MQRCFFWLYPLLLCACTTTEEEILEETDIPDAVWGQAVLDIVTEEMVATFNGEWTLFGLDKSDVAMKSWSWTDVVVGSNPRIEGERALVDVHSEMDGGTWSGSYDFFEGFYIEEDGSVGNRFIETDDGIVITTETSSGVWEHESPLTPTDLSEMANVTNSNIIDGWKSTYKVVSFSNATEHHDVTITTHVEYDDGAEIQTVEYISMTGYHERAN